MASSNGRAAIVVSRTVQSALRGEAVGAQLEQLPPEGGTSSYMAGELTATGNPITHSKVESTNSKVLVGIPRRKENGTLSDKSHLSSLTTAGGQGPESGNGVVKVQHLDISPQDGSGASSSEGNSAEEEEEEEEESDEEEVLTDDQILKDAGVDLEMFAALAASPPSGGVAPLNLLSEFVSCCVRDEYRAASILCKKVLQYEPGNAVAQEFLPLIQERLKLDEELPTESSSSESDDDDDDGSAGSSAEEAQDKADPTHNPKRTSGPAHTAGPPNNTRNHDCST